MKCSPRHLFVQKNVKDFLRCCRPVGLSGRVGLTLIELLAVIAVIAILALILLPVISNVRAAGIRTACLSNMRQIGIATSAYSTDHNGRLPGEKSNSLRGIFVQVGPVYGEWPDEKYTLIEYLRHYMDLPKAPNIAPVMICPGASNPKLQYADRNNPEKNKISYFLNRSVRMVDGTVNPPFGKDYAEANRPPMRLEDVDDLSTAVSLYDADLQIHEIAGRPGNPASFIPKPAHGQSRNFLFLDGHVESLPLDFDPRQQPR